MGKHVKGMLGLVVGTDGNRVSHTEIVRQKVLQVNSRTRGSRPRAGPRNQDQDMYSCWWGGWGSNPRPADYEKYGLMHRTHYLHGWHGVVLLVTLSALVARMARSTNRSTASA